LSPTAGMSTSAMARSVPTSGVGQLAGSHELGRNRQPQRWSGGNAGGHALTFSPFAFAAMCSATRSASAEIVHVGLAEPPVTKMLPPARNRFGTSCARGRRPMWRDRCPSGPCPADDRAGRPTARPGRSRQRVQFCTAHEVMLGARVVELHGMDQLPGRTPRALWRRIAVAGSTRPSRQPALLPPLCAPRPLLSSS
jgi:hypothetical protein